MERPLAVELDDREGRGGGLARGGDDVLAGVVALGGAGPEKEAAVEGWLGEELDKFDRGSWSRAGERVVEMRSERTDGGMMRRIGAAVFLFTYLVAVLALGCRNCPHRIRRIRKLGRLTSTHSWNSGNRSPIDAAAGPASKRHATRRSWARAMCPDRSRRKLSMVTACGFRVQLVRVRSGTEVESWGRDLESRIWLPHRDAPLFAGIRN